MKEKKKTVDVVDVVDVVVVVVVMVAKRRRQSFFSSRKSVLPDCKSEHRLLCFCYL